MSLLLLVSLLCPVARANGQTTHIWINHTAASLLPAGDLRDILLDPELDQMLVGGSMFPDGGYAVGHEYGEAAHWEPFQRRYLAWIQDTYGGAPWSDEARKHIAFLFGMAGHGMADQSFDAYLFNWSQVAYDTDLGWAEGRSLDEASDVIWAQRTGPATPPERWVPTDVLVPLFAAEGIEVDAETITEGQDYLDLAVEFVGVFSEDPSTVDRYTSYFPWAIDAISDPTIPGNPQWEAERVATYWTDLWGRLEEEPRPDVLNTTWPVDGSYGLGTDPESPTSRVSFDFVRMMYDAEVTADYFEIRTDEGELLPTEDPWLFYGNDAGNIHLRPLDPWPTDSWLTVTAKAGLPFTDGSTLAEDISFRVSTAAPPPEADPDPVASCPDGSGECAQACGCASATPPAGGLLLLAPLLLLRRRRC